MVHTTITWRDQMPERDGKRPPVWCIAFKPDGTQLVLAVGNRVLVFDPNEGELIQSLKGHKDTVYCVAYSADGKRFASGGADKNVIIWTSEGKGFLKFTHNDTIQCLAYNPVNHALASCTSSDFGLWSPEQKKVEKNKVMSKVCCCDWTRDGQILALGHFDGKVSLYDKKGELKTDFQRVSGAPIWCLQFNPSLSGSSMDDLLAVGSWDKTLSFWGTDGAQQGKDRKLDFDPCTLNFMGVGGEYIVLGGSDKKVTLWTKEGFKLKELGKGYNGWVWTAVPRPKHMEIAVGTNDGELAVLKLNFATVHGLFRNRYAYRDHMTDVIVQHLITDKKVRIRCRDYIKKIAVYQDRLAVQLPSRVIIYELRDPKDSIKSKQKKSKDGLDPAETNMHYTSKTKINQKFDCNLLMVTSKHIILCQQRRLQLYNFSGVKEREWVLDSVIKYIKILGGPPGKEGVLVGLKSGSVRQIFVNNPFPNELIHAQSAVRCLDISSSRKKLAIVDDSSHCLVYDIDSKELLLREPNADSVAWNTEMEDMLCFSGNGMLSIKTGNYPTHHQKLKGSVVGFNGAKIFCMHNLTMSPIDVPQSASLYRYLEDRNFDKSYQVACLGVTESDWRLLAMEALRQMKLGYARRAFIRVRDMRYIELLNQIEISRRGRSAKNKWKNAESKVAAGNILKKNSNDMYDIAAKMDAREKLPSQDQVFLGHILAYQSRFTDAARVFEKAGHIDLAIEMFLDLKRYDDAKNYASKGKGSSKHSVSDLMKKQAEWSKATADWRSAAQMYVDACEFMKAIELLCENHGVEPLMDIVHKLDGKKDTMELLRCAKYFANNNHHSKAKQVYLKMGAIEDLLRLHMKMYKWEEALALAEEHNGKFDHIVYLPYAEYLAGADRFDEAQAAYKKAGRPEESLKLLTALAECAQIERRFESAACYYRQLSQEHLRVAELLNEDNNDGASSSAMSPGSGGTISKEREKQAKVAVHRIQSEESVTLAGVYFAYALIHQYTEDPFTHLEGDVVFSACCYLMNTLTCKSFRKRSTALHMSGLDPPGISRVHILYALAQTCILENIQAYKLARWTIQQLQQQAVPSLWQNQIDRTIVKIQSKPFSDKEGLAVTCYRCLHTNPLVNNIGTGDCCVNCSSPFMRCNGTFDVLPLVEFKPAEGISRQQSIKLLSQLPGGVDDSSSTSSTDGNNRGSSKSNSPSRGHSNNNSRNFDDGDILGGVDSFDDGYYGGRRGNSGAGYGRGSYGRDNSNSNSSMSSRDTSSNNRSNNRGKEEAFSRQLMKFEPGKKYTMVTVDSKMLLEMSGEDCILVDSPMGNLSYVKNMLPDDTNITVCTGCGCFFRAMSFEFSYLRDGGCPFCKSNNTGTDLDDVETRAIEETRKKAIQRGDQTSSGKDRWEVIKVTVG